MALWRRAFDRMGTFERIFVSVVGVIGLVSVLAAVVGYPLVEHDSLLVVFALLLGSAMCNVFRVHTGLLTSMPYMGVGLGLLAFVTKESEPLWYGFVWSAGYLVSQLLVVRDVRWSFYRTGLASIAATAFIQIEVVLSQVGVWPPVYLILAAAAGTLIKLAGEMIRQRSWWALPSRPALSALLPSRLMLVIGTTAALGLFVYYADTVVIPLIQGSEIARRTPFVLLVGGLILFVAAQFIESRANRRRIDALMTASEGASWAGGSDAVSATLISLAKAATSAESVQLRTVPPRGREIGAAITFDAGHSYLIASRPLGAAPFVEADQRVLETLTQMATEATRIQVDIDILARQARTDPLTGLPNYGALQEALVDANENRPYSRGMAVLFIDLDDFKRLNDNRGHHIGDEVLKVIAQRLVDSVDPQDVVSRIGGDEFVLILKNLSSINDAKAIADRIVTNIGVPFSVDGTEIRPGISVGLAFSSHRELDPKILVTDADRTMLLLKRSRRQGGPSEGSSVSIASHRSTRMNDIVMRAIRERRIVLAFQPIVDVRAGRIWAFESLIRYTDPELGPISPSSLVARAKSLGMIDELTRQVMELSLDAATAFREVVEDVNHITVNFELNQITENRLGPHIRHAVANHPDVVLCIELNERSLVELNDLLREQVQALRDLGALIALDDYGSADSSVAALVRLPMDVLKIDKSLVDNLSDVRNQEVIKALQGFGDNLDYTLVVEGVENAAVEQILLDVGVRMAQGFYYGRPRDLATTLRRLKTSGPRAVLA